MILVEFTGIARVLTGVRDVSLASDPGTTYREIIRQLGIRFPVLVGQVIEHDGMSLLPENKIVLDGKRILPESELDTSPCDGDRLTFMSILAGG